MAAAVLAAALLPGCGGGAGAELGARPLGLEAVALDEPVTTTTSAPLSPTSVAVATTAVGTTLPPPPGLGVGARGPEVLAIEKELAALHYYVGQVDEAYDGNTRDAVLAFQKVKSLERTGRATDDVVAAINAAKDDEAPLIGGGGFKRVEVDRDRQVLFLYENNKVALILNASTGNNARFCSEGWCRRAVTPTGAFTVYSQRTGWETGPLGSLYNSQYFNGGIAIHGSRSVPAYPASHGCVRISMSAAEILPERLSIGTPVYVVAGEEPLPTPVGLNATPVSTPTTIVPDTVPAPTTTTTRPFLSELLSPVTTTTTRP
ncbi:MAG: L,D-transpeptidase family protein [Acidimicrobiales bacterium]